MKIRSRLQISSNKLRNPSDIVKFKWQQSLMANLNKQAKLQYFEKLIADGNSKPFKLSNEEHTKN